MRKLTIPIKASLVLVLGFFLLSLGGCDSNSSSNHSMIFTGETTEPGDNTFYLVQGETTEDTIEIILMASNILAERAYGIAFDLDFDPSVINYTGLDKGSFFEDNGQFEAVYLGALQSNDPSKLVVGITQQAKKYGVKGQGLVASFHFRGLKEGNSKLRFSKNVMMNSDMEAVSGISWRGGEIRVER
ncbi:hypothetical protein JXQ70_04410 [bacterium]|nr:hypothetical protein [bacterium]